MLAPAAAAQPAGTPRADGPGTTVGYVLQHTISAAPNVVRETVRDELEESFNFYVHGRKYMFAPVSLFLFDERSRLRQLLVRVITSRRFDYVVLLLIVANSVILAMTDYGAKDDEGEITTNGSWRNTLVEGIDPVFTALFAAECVFKVVAMGFLLDRGSYLRDPWNWLDFVVVVAGLFSVMPAVPKVSFLRTFRVLRPLKSLKAVPGMRQQVVALLQSIPELLNVVAFLSFLFLIFGILSVQLWTGALHYRCRLTEFPVALADNASWPLGDAELAAVLADPAAHRCVGLADGLPLEVDPDPDVYSRLSSPWRRPRQCAWPVAPEHERICASAGAGRFECPAGLTCGSDYDAWGNKRFTHPDGDVARRVVQSTYIESLNWGFTNFDNIGAALLTIFQSITMEGWVDVMYQVQDAWSVQVAAVYFVVLILIGSFFMLNLTLAVIWDNFAQSREEPTETAEELAAAKAELQDARRAVLDALREHPNRLRRGAFALVQSKGFSVAMTLLILLNTVTLALDQHPMDPDLNNRLELINAVLTAVFTLETLFKLLGLGGTEWAHDRMNVFDAAVVAVGLVELALSPPWGGSDSADDSDSSGGLSALRTFRLFRIIKLARFWPSLQELLETIVKTLGEVGNFSVLLLLFMYIYALVGMQFFAYRLRFDDNGYVVEPADVAAFAAANKPRAHFDNLLWSFVTIFQVLTGENWNTVMYDCRRAVGWPATMYFVSLVVLGNFIVLNLFLAILLGNFSGDGGSDAGDTGLGTGPAASSMGGAAVAPAPGPGPGLESDSSRRQLERRTARRRSSILAPSSPRLTSLTNALAATAGNTVRRRRSSMVLNARAARRGSALVTELRRMESGAADAVPPRGKAFLFLGPENQLRRAVHRTVRRQQFDHAVLFLICVSSVLLALDNPLLDPDSDMARVLKQLDVAFAAIFSAEMIAKMVAYGVVGHRGAYLHNGWNVLDCIIVMVSILSIYASGSTSLRSLRSLRTLRALRPLRMISRNPGLKLVVNALFSSIPEILNVLLVSLLFFVIFAIIGVNNFKGSFYACQGDAWDAFPARFQELVTDPPAWGALNATEQAWFAAAGDYEAVGEPTSKQVCGWLGAEWDQVIDQNFDNVLKGASALFEMSTTEGWVIVMYAGVDAVGIDMQPQRDHNPPMVVFFILFMIVGTFFVMNLFVGVVIDNFNRMKEQLGDSIFLTDAQKEWVRIQEAMMKIKPARARKLPRGTVRRLCARVTLHPSFELVIMGCIVANTLIMAMNYFGQSEAYERALEGLNYFFAGVFTVEAAVKVTAWGPARYWKEGWNRFDLCIVCGTNVGLILSWATGVSIGPIASIVRTFRVGRIFRLIKAAPTLNQLFNTLVITMPSLVNIGSLLFLLFFIYSVMGVQLYAKVKLSDDLNEHANFQDFWTAMLTMVRSSTGENWNGIMYDCTVRDSCTVDPAYDPDVCGFSGEASGDCTPIDGCGNSSAYAFFMTFTLLVTFVMLNVFIAVVLEGFGSEKDQAEASLTEDQYQKFVSTWEDFDVNGTFFMDWNVLFHFLQAVPPPMGFGDKYVKQPHILQHLILQLQLPTYKGNRVFFSDVAKALAERVVAADAKVRGEDWLDLPLEHDIHKRWRRQSVFQSQQERLRFDLQHFYAAAALQETYRTLQLRRRIAALGDGFLSRPGSGLARRFSGVGMTPRTVAEATSDDTGATVSEGGEGGEVVEGVEGVQAEERE